MGVNNNNKQSSILKNTNFKKNKNNGKPNSLQ